MAGLQRSAVSFRRQGSSGFVWDDRFLSGELNKVNPKEDQVQQQGQQEEQEQQQHKGEINIKEHHAGGTTTNNNGSSTTNAGGATVVQRSRSNGGARGYRTGKVSPAIEPPSPKLSACGFCGAFGKKTGEKGQRRSKPGSEEGIFRQGFDSSKVRQSKVRHLNHVIKKSIVDRGQSVLSRMGSSINH